MTSTRLFHIYANGMMSSDLRVCDSNKQQLYLVHSSHFSLSKPDLTLHAGSTKKCPVVAVAEVSSFSSTIRVGLGDPKSNYGGVTWEAMTRAGLCGSKCQFQANVQRKPLSGFPGTERRSFLWKSTSSIGAGGAAPSRFLINYKMVDAETDEVLAVFSETPWAMEKRGKLEIRKDWGRELELATMMTAFGILIKKTSQRAAAAS